MWPSSTPRPSQLTQRCKNIREKMHLQTSDVGAGQMSTTAGCGEASHCMADCLEQHALLETAKHSSHWKSQGKGCLSTQSHTCGMKTSIKRNFKDTLSYPFPFLSASA